MKRVYLRTFNVLFLLQIFIQLSFAQKLTPKIIGGYNVSSINGFKHQVSIRNAVHERSMFGAGHLCGGSLIDSNTVLTAAHCVHDGYHYLRPNYYIVVMGNLDLYTRSSDTIVRNLNKIIGHAKYDPDTFVNDIALLIFKTAVPTNHPTVQPITVSSYEATAGQKCIASGWGTTEFQEDGAKAVRWLMAVNISINSRSQCNRISSHAGSVIRGQFCAGSFEGGQDTCQGDSGGPLTCDGILMGITSHGYECGLPNYPGIYMDVAYYKEWIAAASGVTFIFANVLLCQFLLIILTVF